MPELAKYHEWTIDDEIAKVVRKCARKFHVRTGLQGKLPLFHQGLVDQLKVLVDEQ
jgi:hypothetical protein